MTLLAILITLALMMIASLVINTVDIWILWTRLGDEEFYIVVAIVLYFLLPRVQQGLVLVLSVLLSGSLNIVLKYTFNMPRPPDPLIEVYGPSFPSGHAQVSSSFWSALSFITINKLIAAMSAIVIAGVSLSRIFLRAHYGIDVVVGAVLGLAIGYVSYLAFTYYMKSGSHVLYYVNAGVVATMSACSMMIFSAELSSSTAILGLSLAILTILPIARSVLAKPYDSSIAWRIMVSFVFVTLLLSIHLITKSFAPLIRLISFYVAGLCVFMASLALRSHARKHFKLMVR